MYQDSHLALRFLRTQWRSFSEAGVGIPSTHPVLGYAKQHQIDDKGIMFVKLK